MVAGNVVRHGLTVQRVQEQLLRQNSLYFKRWTNRDYLFLNTVTVTVVNLEENNGMDAVIKISSAEFNENLFSNIKEMLNGKEADITIAIRSRQKDDISRNETQDEYWSRLSKAVTDIENGKGITFTMQELEELIHK